MTRTHKVQEEIRKIDSLIDTAQNMLAEGLMADFTSIKDKVTTICSQIHEMDLEKGKKLKGDLENIVIKMDVLARELTISFSNGFPEKHLIKGEFE
jgi:3-phosphoglycerate kinase